LHFIKNEYLKDKLRSQAPSYIAWNRSTGTCHLFVVFAKNRQEKQRTSGTMAYSGLFSLPFSSSALKML
jgi:hypothetical protein